MQNTSQIPKNLKAYHAGSKFALAAWTLNRDFSEIPKDSSIFFLGRYNEDKEILKSQFHLNIDANDNIEIPKRKARFLTVHRSKGLEADYVFIVNNKSGTKGFPSNVKDANIIKLLSNTQETYPYAEERRLYYVAITRAKRKVFFMLPQSENQTSIFFKEFKNLHQKEFENESRTCPQCGNPLKPIYKNNYAINICSNETCNFKRDSLVV